MFNIIVATTKDNIIGINNKLPFSCSNDIKFFREKTINNIVVMGRKTFNSLNNKYLQNRANIIISSNKNISPYNSLEDYLLCQVPFMKENQDKIWIIGGASIYQQAQEFYKKYDLKIKPKAYISIINGYALNPTLENNVVLNNELTHWNWCWVDGMEIHVKEYNDFKIK